MIIFRNECCNCATPGYPCLGSMCPNRNVPVHVCDECGTVIEDAFGSLGIDLCERCKDGL